MPVQLVARMDIGDVNLDDRTREGLERIEHCDRCERVGRRVDDERVGLFARRLDQLDQLAFMV
jgi:hypothetical protein